MDKKHYYSVYWKTRCGYSYRTYFRRYTTEAEAVKKARQVDKNPEARDISVVEKESWETPDPAPNGTLHVKILGPIRWWME